MLKKEKEETKDKYPWLYQGDKRTHMSDKEILEKYVDLGKTLSVRFREETSNGYVT